VNTKEERIAQFDHYVLSVHLSTDRLDEAARHIKAINPDFPNAPDRKSMMQVLVDTCSSTCAVMILKQYGYRIDDDAERAILAAVGYHHGRGIKRQDMYHVIKRFIPQARYFEKITPDILADLVRHRDRHSAHVGMPGYKMGHVVVVDGVRRKWWTGRITHFFVRDPMHGTGFTHNGKPMKGWVDVSKFDPTSLPPAYLFSAIATNPFQQNRMD